MVLAKLFLLIVLCVALSEAIKVAIIGGGVGGASSAYFLKTMHKGEISIDIYEPNRIGGRLAVVEHDGKAYENGGSIIHEKNVYMSKFVEEFGLQKNYICGENFAIFDGPFLLFQSSSYTVLTLLKFVWKYGFDIFRLDIFVKKLIDTFSRVYDVEGNKGYPYESTYDILGNIDTSFLNLLNTSSYKGFIKEGFSDDFIREIIGPIIQCNYCQTTSIHHFVGSVAVAGSGSTLWSVKGGNWQVPFHLIMDSGAKIINDTVIAISPLTSSPKLVISTKTFDEIYDYVIVATPLTSNNKINFNRFGKRSPDKFHTTICTFVKGELNMNSFHTYGKIIPDTLLFTPGYIVNAMSKATDVSGDCEQTNVWKIFSERVLKEDDLNRLFESHSVISVTEWKAYPDYSSRSENRSFYLFENVKNLLYVNAIETLASAMEMSIIGAHNVASLVIQDIHKKPTFEGAPHDEL